MLFRIFGVFNLGPQLSKKSPAPDFTGPFPQDVRHVDHDGRVHVRDVVAGMKAVVYRRATSNSVESSRKLRDEGMAGMTEEYS